MADLAGFPHRRYNPLTDEWVLVSPHRAKRPWQGQVEAPPPEHRPPYDPQCYLCPGNTRVHGDINPGYKSTFVFNNDFAALLPETPQADTASSPLYQIQEVRGTSRVVCYSPRHDLTLPEMALEDILRVVKAWADQFAELGQEYRWVQVFQNKGEMMGCSNPHPHGQIWAGNRLPNEPAKEDRQQRSYSDEHGYPLLLDYVEEELQGGKRVVLQNEHWVSLVPYWAVWPFEILLIPRRHVVRFPDLNESERHSLAQILKELLIKYDNLFKTSFPYSMGWHGAPFLSDRETEHWQLHAHFYPPLLRSATVRKFLVGYEMLAEAQRDITAETAASQLRDLPRTHYKHM